MRLLLSLVALTLQGSLVHGVPSCKVKPHSASTSQDTNTSTPVSGSCSSQPNNSSFIDALATGWYPGWLGDQSPPENLTWSKYTAMTFAFAVTTPNGGVSMDDISKRVLPQFGVKALLSIGGWTGSQYFSSAVATPQSRTAFVKTVVGLVSQYKLDGIDFDWEYPNRQGVGCNEISPQDSANLLSFLQELRKDPVGSKIILSAAVVAPFTGPDGQPMGDVSEFARVLDWVAIMDYDVWGSWSTSVGPNAPLDDSCGPSKQGSAVSFVNAWTSAGYPAEKIALGVAAYGHSFHVTNEAAYGSSTSDPQTPLKPYPPFDKNQQPHGDSQDGEAGLDQCGNQVGVGGIFNFWGLINQGFLDASGKSLSGISYAFDECSQTPYVYNPSNQVMVSYDDTRSFAAKGSFIKQMGLKGFAMWHVLGDSNNILVDAITGSMGIVETCDA